MCKASVIKIKYEEFKNKRNYNSMFYEVLSWNIINSMYNIISLSQAFPKLLLDISRQSITSMIFYRISFLVTIPDIYIEIVIYLHNLRTVTHQRTRSFLVQWRICTMLVLNSVMEWISFDRIYYIIKFF